MRGKRAKWYRKIERELRDKDYEIAVLRTKVGMIQFQVCKNKSLISLIKDKLKRK